LPLVGTCLSSSDAKATKILKKQGDKDPGRLMRVPPDYGALHTENLENKH
jgi:hypothetical protein